jgi:hypothetical protein
MPGGWEAGLRLAEHYSGRANTAAQTVGIFPSVDGAPDISAGRVVRDRNTALTGIAAQSVDTITHHGVRPTFRIPIHAKPEDMPLPLMAFFHNCEYTQISVPSGNTGEGTFKYGMLDAKPDHIGNVVGTYDPLAASYGGLVAMSDVYTMAIEWLYGHGDLGDTDNGIAIYNAVVNSLTFSVDRGVDQYLGVTLEGFGRTADENADFAAASWGPGVNGAISTQSVLTPESMTLNVLDVNAVDVTSTFSPWLDGLTIECTSGLGGRDALGQDEYNAIQTEGRPSVTGSIRMAHVSGEFLDAVKLGQKIALQVTFTNSANEEMKIDLPLLKIVEGFSVSSGDVNADATVEIPFKALVDTTVTKPLIEVTVDTTFDIRSHSFHLSSTLAAQ